MVVLKDQQPRAAFAERNLAQVDAILQQFQIRRIKFMIMRFSKAVGQQRLQAALQHGVGKVLLGQLVILFGHSRPPGVPSLSTRRVCCTVSSVM